MRDTCRVGTNGVELGCMRTVLNVIWLILAGVWLALGYVLAAVTMAITIIGIPFAAQAIKLAGYALWPFGRSLVPSASRHEGLSVFRQHPLVRPSGRWFALEHLIVGVLLCITIIGIPLGLGAFKMAGAALVPFGKEIVELRTLAEPPEDAVVIGTESDR
jgi:uncharacterized membrane protein YccF (DUF307 family)